MRICLVSPIPPPYGGIGNWSLLLKGYFEGKDGFDVSYVNIAPKNELLEERSFWNRIVVKGCEMLRQKKDLRRLLISKDFDLMHLTTSGRLALVRDRAFLRVAKSAGVPTVYHIHFGRVPQIAKKNTAEWRMMRRNMRLASRVIAMDPATLEAIGKYAPEVRANYVPNPVDAEAILRCTRSASHRKEKKELVFLGWVAKAKGIDLLLAAWETLCERYPEWCLRIVGNCNDSYARELQRNFSLQNVIFDGEKSHDEAMSRLAEADVFVLPSYTEGFPYAVLEAMTLGRAIVATDVGAIPEMLKGECGRVIPAGDSKALTDALETLMGDESLRKELGKGAQCRVAECYTLRRVMEQYKKTWSEARKENDI